MRLFWHVLDTRILKVFSAAEVPCSASLTRIMRNRLAEYDANASLRLVAATWAGLDKTSNSPFAVMHQDELQSRTSMEPQMDEDELNQPAVLMYWPQTVEAAQPGIWQPQRRFPRLRDAIMAAMSDMPNDQVPWILTETGALKPDDIRGIFEKLTASRY